MDGPQSTVDPDGLVARRQYHVFLVTIWVSIGIFVAVGTLLAYCLVKFRHPGEITEDTPPPPQGHGNAFLEIGLILVSVILVAIMLFPTIPGIFYAGTLPEGQDVLVIKATGYQWWWKFEYPDHGVITGNEIAMPAGRPVKFELKTADVIHSFWIPRLGGKMDMMPNQDNWLWLQADPGVAKGAIDTRTNQPSDGIYYGQCAEFCGESHAFMRFRVRVLNEMDFEQWLVDQKAESVQPEPGTPEAAGMKVFNASGCAFCHSMRGNIACVPAKGAKGPDLTHFGSRLTVAAGVLENTPENLEKWLLNPHAVKPGNIMWTEGYLNTTNPRTGVKGMDVLTKLNDLTPEDFQNLVVYLESLK